MGHTGRMLLPQFSPSGPADGPSLIMAVRDGRVALSEADAAAPPPPGAMFVGSVGGRHCWALDAGSAPGAPAAEGSDARPAGSFVGLMQLYPAVDEATWAAAGRAVQLVEWSRNHRFCGRCGTPTEDSASERSRRCPNCGLSAFPRLAPAVIALVEREDGRALLARNARWPTAMYSCLAGFVEPGETVEEAVGREIREEVGVDVDGLRYFGSQPWPFPHSLMLGFSARYAGGDIVCDGEEIADARWFSVDDLPQIPGPISIARRLIDDWVARSGATR